MARETTHELDRYLADELSADERLAFEQRLAAEPELRAELAFHQQINASLRTALTPPPTALVAPATAAAAGWTLFGLGWKTGLTTVGLLVALGTGWWLAAGRGDPRDAQGPDYAQLLGGAFLPAIREADPQRLGAVLSAKLGRQIRLAADPRVTYLGFEAGRGGTPLRIRLYARCDGAPVLVVLDLPAADSGPPPGPGLHESVVEAGGLRLREISAAARPCVLPRIEVGR